MRQLPKDNKKSLSVIDGTVRRCGGEGILPGVVGIVCFRPGGRRARSGISVKVGGGVFMAGKLRPTSSPPALYPLLDAMRFAAAALVTLTHLRGRLFLSFSEVECASDWLKRAFFSLTRLGSESVVVFFVLSGFLVGGMSVERFVRGRFDPAKYFIDRLSRIYTPLVPNIVLTVITCIVFGFSTNAREVLVSLASLQGAFGPAIAINESLWSLTYEVWFYVLCGGLLSLFQGQAGHKWFSFALVAASAFVFARLEVAYVFAWLLGSGAFFLKGRGAAYLLLIGTFVTALGVVAMQLTSISTQVDLKGFNWIDRSLAIVTLAAGMSLVVAAAASVRVGAPTLLKIGVWFQWLAQFSYTLYLVHVPLILVLVRVKLLRPFGELNAVTFSSFIGTAMAIGVVAWLLYLPFERQTPVVRRWLYAQLLPGSHAEPGSTVPKA